MKIKQDHQSIHHPKFLLVTTWECDIVAMVTGCPWVPSEWQYDVATGASEPNYQRNQQTLLFFIIFLIFTQQDSAQCLYLPSPETAQWLLYETLIEAWTFNRNVWSTLVMLVLCCNNLYMYRWSQHACDAPEAQPDQRRRSRATREPYATAEGQLQRNGQSDPPSIQPDGQHS